MFTLADQENVMKDLAFNFQVLTMPGPYARSGVSTDDDAVSNKHKSAWVNKQQ